MIEVPPLQTTIPIQLDAIWLSNALAVFQELMRIVLEGQDEFVIEFLDDIPIFSETLEDHLRHI